MCRFLKVFPLILFLIVSGCSEDGSDTDKSANNIPENSQETPFGLLDVSEREYGDINAIALLFNHPLKERQRFSKFINVEPLLAEPVLSQDARTLYFTGVKPDQEYRLSLTKGLQSGTGEEIESASEHKLKSRQLYPIVGFEVDGAVLIPGKVTSIPLTALNVPEADVDFYKVKMDQVTEFFSYYRLMREESWYYDQSEISRYIEHVYSTRIKTGSEKNKRYQVNLPLTGIQALQAPGVYFAAVKQPGSFKYSATTWFTSSSIGLHARDYGQDTQFVIQDAASGKLLSGVTIKILDENNREILSGESNAEGVWKTANNSWQKKSPSMILAQSEGQLTVLDYAASRFDLSAFDVGLRPFQQIEHYVFSPRDIYRPGDKFDIGILKRDEDGQLLDGLVNIELFRPDGETQGTWQLNPDQPGYYTYSFDLPENAPLGFWQAKITSPERSEDAERFDFQVEEFLPERMRIQFDQGDQYAVFEAGQELNVSMLGEYLYGAPAAGNLLDTEVVISPWQQPFEQFKGYRFGSPEMLERDSFELSQVQMGQDGRNVTRLGAKDYAWQNINTPARVQFRYSLYESGGRAVNRSQSVRFWPKESFIGVKPHFEQQRTDSNSLAAFSLIRAGAEGNLIQQGEARVKLYREEENYFWSYTPEQGWHYQTDKNEYVVATRIISFVKNDPVDLQLPVEWGAYRLEVEDMSAKSLTVYGFHAGESWYTDWQDSDDKVRPDRINLSLNQAEYSSGSEVVVKLNSPTSGRALVMLETDQVVFSTEVTLRDKQAEVVIPIPEDLNRHDAYISAFVIAPTDDNDKIRKRSMGIIHLPLKRAERRLSVDFELPERWVPEQQVIAKLKVTDAAGSPVKGKVFVTLAAVDAGVVSLTGYTSADPFNHFYGQRRYLPKLYDMYDYLVEKSLYKDAEIRWGGDADLTQGGELPDSHVEIFSFLSSPIEVVDGVAEIPLDLPVFDGELKLNVLAAGDDSFGVAEASIKVASPIVVQLSAPKFMAAGDRARTVLDLSNTSDTPQLFHLNLNAEGSIKVESISQSIELPVAGSTRLEIPFEGVSIGVGSLKAALSFDDKVISRQWDLPVRQVYPSLSGVESRLVEKGQRFSFPEKSITKLSPSSLKAAIRISSTPELLQDEHRSYLQAYPYACLEQTTSKASLLLTDNNFPSFTKIMERYQELQQENGGFGLWQKHSPEEHWLTVFATERLLQLEAREYPVKAELLEAALDRIEEYVFNYTPVRIKTRSDVPSHYEYAFKSYAAYLLARQGRLSLGRLRDLVEPVINNSRGPMPGTHLGLAMIAMGQIKAGNVMLLKSMDLPRAEGYLGDYGSDLRDQAMILSAILQVKGVDKNVRGKALAKLPALAALLNQTTYLSTQERSALLNLSEVLRVSEKGAGVNGQLFASDVETKISSEGTWPLSSNHVSSTHFINESEKALYISYRWTGVPEEQPDRVDAGIKVEVNQFLLKDSQATPLIQEQPLRFGDLVLTSVRMVSSKSVPDALLVGLLPPGLELENQNLKHAIKLQDLLVDGQPLELQQQLLFQEYRDDRYVAALELRTGQEEMLYYLARAVTPGVYQQSPVQVESMYTPSIRGLAGGLNILSVEQ